MENKHILHMIFMLLFAQCLLGKIITNRVRQHFHLSIELKRVFIKRNADYSLLYRLQQILLFCNLRHVLNNGNLFLVQLFS